MIDDYMSQFQTSFELNDPVPQEDEGVWRLWLSEDLSIVISDQEPGFHFYAKLCEVGQSKLEELFTILMVNNLFGLGTGGGVLGLDETGKVATLSFTREEKTDYRDFERDIEEFMNYAEFWKREIEKHQQESSEGAFL